MSTSLAVNRIRTDGGTQARVQLDWVAVGEYSAAMQAGDVFPPVVVFHDGVTYWLADGFHRVDAARRAGVDELAADVRMGTQRDAILYAVGANSSHGVRRTNADKRAAVLKLLADEEWKKESDHEIARRVGVSQPFVTGLRPKLSDNGYQIDRKATRNGTTYEVNTTNIGRKVKQPVPAAEQRRFIPAVAPATWTPPALVLIPAREEEPEADPEAYDETPELVTPEHLPVCIFNADSSRFLTEFVTRPVHLVVTSPPYNVGIDYGAHTDQLATHLDLLTDVWRQCHAVMVDGARIAVVVPFGVGRNPWVPFSARVMETLEAAGFTLRGQIIWDKNTTGNRTSWGSFRMASAPALRDTTECIIIAHKGEGTLPIPPEHAYRDDKGSFTAWLADSDYFMELAQDHWAIQPESAQRVKHPAPFPVELVRRLVHFYAYPTAHLLDPFGGSGTVGVAARELGCMATLFDISADYCRLAEERISRD